MVTVKLLDQGDFDLLCSADVSVFDQPIQPDLARTYLAHPDYLIALASDGETVVGMASGLFHFHPDKPLEFWINEVGVAESHQRLGIAKTLMRCLLDGARKKGVTSAWVATETDNEAARALYRSIGGREDQMAYFEFGL